MPVEVSKNVPFVNGCYNVLLSTKSGIDTGFFARGEHVYRMCRS